MTRRLYNRNMYRFGEPQPSYWEATAGPVEVTAPPLDGSETCDVAIVGGGYTGLSAAYHLARDYQLDVRVLEAGHIGWGASGRNGGFCCIGATALELSQQLATYGVENVRHFYQAQVDAVGLVASLIHEEEIDTPMQGECELEAAHSPRAFDDLKHHAGEQFRLLGLDTQALSADEFRETYFDSAEQYGGTLVRPGFALHPMRYIKGLAQAAVNKGARLHAHSEILSWRKDGQQHILETAAGTIRAERVIVGANGFMPEHLRKELHGVPLPMISAIIVTRPLSSEELAAHDWSTECPAINTRELFNYFRLLPDGRFMIGGRGTTTGSEGGALIILENLKKQLARQWPAWSDVGIDYFWHGLVCMTRRLTPCLGRLQNDPSVFYGFGYHGNGVNTSTWTGKQIADWLGQSRVDATEIPDYVPVMMRGLSPKFPLPSMRLNYLRMALGWKGFQDWRSE